MTITWPIGEKPPPLDEPMVILMVREPGQQMRTRMRLLLAPLYLPRTT
jgi:hypothetical protein